MSLTIWMEFYLHQKVIGLELLRVNEYCFMGTESSTVVPCLGARLKARKLQCVLLKFYAA